LARTDIIEVIKRSLSIYFLIITTDDALIELLDLMFTHPHKQIAEQEFRIQETIIVHLEDLVRILARN
jgi:hypothetical protein